jgi:DNA (cytosine-5)-methyltransferase 1
MLALEICAGAGGQALGLEEAGFQHVALVEIDECACGTLKANRPHWNVIEEDVRAIGAKEHRGIDLLAGGVPCPPFSIAGKQLGGEDERDLFPEMMRLAGECEPKALMIENVKGLFSPKFDVYRAKIVRWLEEKGYACFWRLVHAHQHCVPQLRSRSLLVALKEEFAPYFSWPSALPDPPPTVGQTLHGEMASGGWKGAEEWAKNADGIAPTLVGGSKKHGGADLGPTRAKEAWRKLGVDGLGVADSPPRRAFVGLPRLTVKMAALVQGFPPDWKFEGKKTSAYRQVGNAFPPPVARAAGKSIFSALRKETVNQTG